MAALRVAVIGLGATGSAALWHLARRGVRAVGIERFDLGHPYGSSHGATRIIRLAHFENAAYVPLMRRAYTLWRELETAAAARLIVTTGIAEIGSPDGPLVRGTVAGASRHDLPHEMIDAQSLMRRYPAFNLPASFVAVLSPDGGYIAAEAALAAHIRLARAAGAAVRTRETVLAVEPLARGVRIRTDRGEIECDSAVLAAGPWMAKLLPDLARSLRVTRQVVGWFEPVDEARFSADRFPVFILESEHGLHYGFPVDAAMGAGLKIAKHHHRRQAVDPDSYDRTVSAADEADIRAPLPDYLPAADGRLIGAQTCLYTMTPDETFIIDRLPGFPHVVIASPCSGHGFKFSPAVGEILADLVTLGATDHDIGRFRLGRFG